MKRSRGIRGLKVSAISGSYAQRRHMGGRLRRPNEKGLVGREDLCKRI